MIDDHWFRRIVHMSSPLFLIYYWLPEKLWSWGPEKSTSLIGLLILFWSYELIRMLWPKDQPRIIGFREYEYHRISAMTWALTGIFMCFLAFPIEYTAPALCGMAWVDPLIGELRRNGSTLYPVVPLTIYFAIVLVILTIFMGLTGTVLVAAVGATLMAIFIEGVRLWRLDDDLTMMVLPCVTIAAWFTLVDLF